MDQIQEAYINLALALRRAGEYEEAVAALRKAVERDPQAVTPYLALGLVLNDAGQYTEAESVLRRALELVAEENADVRAAAWVALGMNLCAQGRDNESIEVFQKAAEILHRLGRYETLLAILWLIAQM